MSTPRVMFKAMVFACVGMVLVYFGVGVILADEWHVDSARTIQVPPAKVAALVQDFGTWHDWSSMEADLGPQTQRTVTGTAGTAAHRITWSGSQGVAMLTIAAAGPDFVAYDFHAQGPGEDQPVWRGRGRIEWSPDGAGCRVRWHDESRWDSLPGRWIGWFGALQERVRQIQGTSLEGLEQALGDRGTPAPK